MAFTVTARQSGTNGGTSAANLTTSSATPTANSLFIVGFGIQVDDHGTQRLPVIATPTGGGYTYTLIDKDGDVTPYLWGSSDGFWCGGAMFRAAVGGSPSAHTVVVDGTATGGSGLGFHAAVCLDITGHNASSPIVQQAHNGARINPEATNATGTVTLGSAPTAGNLIVVMFTAGPDSSGGTTAPTAGAGKTFTALSNNQTTAFQTTGAWYRVADGSESATITTTNLGNTVGNYVAVAFEVAAAGGGSNATATPSVVASAAAVPSATIKLGALATAALVAAVSVVPSPAVSSGSNANASAPLVAATATVPSVTLHTSTATSPSTVAGAAAVPAATVAAHRYVTGISGRHFVDQDGSPILIRGESPWAMFTKLSSSEMDTYLQNRASYGCNLALVSMIGAVANGAPADTGATYDGILPFTGGNPTVFNSAYWARMDTYIAKARDLGITLMIYPMDGWNTAFSSVVFNPGSISNTQCQTYGQTLATRYLSYPNIVWSFGGDYNEDSTINARYNACLTGIRAAGDTRPVTIQLLYETSESSNSTFWEPKVDWDFVYTYYVTYKGVSDSYNHTWSAGSSVKPALFSEGAYENSGAPHNGTDSALRRQACWALTSGSPGEMTGQEGVWNFQSGWASLLDTTAADQMKAIRDTFEAIDWWTLVPDDANQLVTAGRGTRITADSATFPSGNTYVTAARATDGGLAVIYLPNASSAITVDMTKIGAHPVGTWVDPTNGATSSATIGSTYSKGNNAAGSTDWLLILTGDTGTAVPSAVAAVAAVAAPMVQAGAKTVPAVVAGSATVPAPTVRLGVTATPLPVTATAAIPSPAPAGNALATPASVSAVATVPVVAAVSTGGKATPAGVAGTATVPAPSVSAGGSAAAAPAALVAVAVVPAPSVRTASIVGVSAVPAVTSLPVPAVVAGSGAVVSPAAVTCVTSVPAPVVRLGANPAPVAVVAIATVPTPSLRTSLTLPAAVVSASASVPEVQVFTFVPLTIRPNTGRTIRPDTGITDRP